MNFGRRGQVWVSSARVDSPAALPLIDGRFRLLRLLAVGGMGELYLAIARDAEIEGLEQLVVMKRILPEFAANHTVVTMFLIEARIAARLDHPNVVRVFDMGKADGSLYFTMEYLHGADLGRLYDAAKARGGDFALGHAITIIMGVCCGLHFAHEMQRVDGRPMGIVHRDVSPGNVFVTYDGEIKVVDFGIAKVLSRKRITNDGTRKGKLAYMSPEQVNDGPIDRRSDVFALGILLYELVTLTHLFDGDNEYAIMEKISRGEVPPPSTRRRGVAPELERIILKALALRPADRHPTALALAEDLERFATGHQVRVSMLGLKQYLRRMIGDAEYPWYLDEEGPEERAAVEQWFASAQPDEVVEETEIDINLSGLFEIDEEEEEFYDEYEEEAEAQPLAPIAVVAPPPVRPPVRPRVSRRQAMIGAAAVTGLTAAALLGRCACGSSEPPPVEDDDEIEILETIEPAPAPAPARAAPPLAPPTVVPVATPAVEPVAPVVKPKVKKKAKKKPAKQKPAKKR